MKSKELIVSPCTRNCKLDIETEVCQSCGLTHEEMQDWQGFDSNTRLRIMYSLGYGKPMNDQEILRRYEKG